METRRVPLPDGSIGIFRADHTDAQIRSIIDSQFPNSSTPVDSDVTASVPVIKEPQQNQTENVFDNLILAESSGRQFDNRGRTLESNKGALGIAQVLPGTAADPGYNIPSIFNLADQLNVPYQNRDEESARALLGNETVNRAFGESYYSAMLDRYNGDQERALVAYNWGPSNADKWDGSRDSLPKETKDYVTKILGSETRTTAPEVAPEVAPEAEAQTQRVRLPDGSIGIFRADHTDAQIRSIIENEFPGAYNDLNVEDETIQTAPEQREGIPFFREFMPGVSSAFTQIGAIPEGLSAQRDAGILYGNQLLIAAYEKIDSGIQFNQEQAAELAKDISGSSAETILLYQNASDAEKTKIKNDLETKTADRLIDFNENIAELQRVQRETALQDAPNVANFSDIRSAADFADYMGYMMGSGAAQYLPTLTAGVAGGLIAGPPGAVTGAVTVSTIQALPQQTQQRLGHILKVTENMTSDEERADAIIEYLTKTAETSALVALAQGGLDAFGATKVLSGIFKKKLSGEAGEEFIKEAETVREAAMQVVRETPRALGEEGITGALQEVADMTGQYSLGERKGDVFTSDNLIQVIDAGIAEAVGGLSAQGINIGVASGKQKLRNNAKAALKQKLEESSELNDDTYSNEDIDALADDWISAVDKEIATATEEGKPITEVEALQRAGRVVSENRKAEKEVTEELKPEVAPKEVVSEVVSEVVPEVTPKAIAEVKFDNMPFRDAKQKNKIKSIFNEQYTQEQFEADFADGKISIGKKGKFTLGTIKQVTTAAAPTATTTAAAPTATTTAATPTDAAVKTPKINNVFKAKLTTFGIESIDPSNFEDEITYARDTVTAIQERAEKIKKQQDAVIESLGIDRTDPTSMTPELQAALAEDPLGSLNDDNIIELAEEQVLEEFEAANINPYADSEIIAAAANSGKENKDEEVLANEVKENPGPAIGEGALSGDIIDTTEQVSDSFNINDAPKAPSVTTTRPIKNPAVNPIYDTLETIANEGDPRDVRAVDILSTIEKTKQSTPFESLIAKNPQLKTLLQGVSVRFVEPSELNDNRGSYTETVEGERIITLAKSVSGNDGRNNQTFLHEAIHAATARIVKTYEADPQSPLIKPKQRRALENLERLMGKTESRLAKKRSKGLITDAEKYLSNANAFKDLSEFVAYGMSSPEMQTILQETPAANAKYGGLSNFIKLVREVLGLNKSVKTAFEELIIITDRLIDTKAFNLIPSANIVAFAKKESQTEATAKRKLSASRAPITFLDALGDVYKQRSLQSAVDLLDAIKDSITLPSLKAVLYTLPTQTIVDLGNRIYKLNGLKRIQTAVRRISSERTKRLRVLAAEVNTYNTFIRKFGSQLNRFLSDSMHLSTLWDIDGNKFKTYEQAVKADAKLKEFEALTNDKKESDQRRKFGQREVTKRKTQLRIFYKGFMTSRKNSDEYQGWEKLNAETNGEANKIYRMVKLRYQENFKEYYDSLVERIKRSKDVSEEAKNNILQTIQLEMLQEIKAGVYFPLMRFGEYYVGRGRGAKRTFQMFESSAARNKKVREIVREYQKNNPTDTRTVAEIEADITEIGDSTELKDELSGKKDGEASELLRAIFKQIDESTVIDPTSQQKTLTNINSLKNDIYQLYIKVLPEQSMRKRFLKRKGTAGFSGDAFRAFLASNHQSINQLSKLKHDNLLRGAIASAYAELSGRGSQNLLKARAYVDRLVVRAMDDVHGDPIDVPMVENLVRFGNQAAFIFYLTSAKSAIVQFTQLPIVGLPILAAKFGMTKSFVTAVKYLNVYNKLASFKQGEDGQLKMVFEAPDLAKTKHVLQDIPEDYRQWYQDAIDAADSLDIFNETFSTDASQMTRVPTQTYNSASARGLRTMFNFMGGAFHYAERSTRQIMFMSTLDLEMEQQMQGYERELTKLMDATDGMTRAQAVEALYAPYRTQKTKIRNLMSENKFLVDSGRYSKEDAINELLAIDKKIKSPRAAAKRATLNAVDLSYEALFDYGQFNKSEILKGRGLKSLVRIPAQFMTFPINMTIFMARNFYNMLPLLKNNTQKKEAAIKFFGAQGMAFMFAGATGLWQYSTLMGLLEGIREAFRPEGEEEDPLYDMNDDGAVLGKRNLDLWFREWFLPTYFGPDSTLADAFGLTKEQALTLQRAVKLGPVSALTDYNIGSSTSLDGLFFTSGRSSDDLKDMMARGLKEKMFGPVGGLASDFYTAITEDFANGDFKKGAEKFTPATFRGLIKASRVAEEGERSRQLQSPRSAEWYHTGKLIGISLGFSVTETAEIREKNLLAKDLEVSILDERVELLARYDKAVLDAQTRKGGRAEALERVQEVWKDIGVFNVRNGLYAIGEETIYTSLSQKQKRRYDALVGEGLMFKSPNSLNAILPLVIKSAVFPDYSDE